MTLVAYADAALRHFRIDNPGQVGLQADVDAVLASAGGVTPERGLRRSDLMAMVDEVEQVLTIQETSA